MQVWERERDEERREGAWTRVAIPAGGLALRRDEAGRPGFAVDGEAIATLVPFRGRGGLSAALVLSPSARRALVGGYRPLPVVVLRHRDELYVEGRIFYFSQIDAPPSVTRLTEAEPALHCARCRRRLEAGDLVLRCAACGAPYHEGDRSDEGAAPLRCASYDPRCGGCGRSWEECTWTPGGDDGA